MGNLTIIYGKDGQSYSDYQCTEILITANSEAVQNDVTIFTSTENVIFAARCLYAEKKVDKFILKFAPNGPESAYPLKMNENATISHWPRGFCDYSTDCLDRILRARFAI